MKRFLPKLLLAWPLCLPFPALAALSYERDIMPIFESKCFECHSAKQKVKGGLRLDDPEHFYKRFAKNSVVIPGDWDGSYLFVALETSREIAIVDTAISAEIGRIDTGLQVVAGIGAITATAGVVGRIESVNKDGRSLGAAGQSQTKGRCPDSGDATGES